MLLGHWMEMRAVQSAQGSLKELSRLLPDQAEVVIGDKTKTVALEELQVGDMIWCVPAEKYPLMEMLLKGNPTSMNP